LALALDVPRLRVIIYTPTSSAADRPSQTAARLDDGLTPGYLLRAVI
jgi:hypothetical protein